MIENLYRSIEQHPDNACFYINGQVFEYSFFRSLIGSIQHQILPLQVASVGVITNDDIETYASILAVLFSGKAFIPIDPKHPDSRNKSILDQADVETILVSGEQHFTYDFLEAHREKFISINKQHFEEKEPRFVHAEPDALAYILFTSGSTGLPKGVPVRRISLETFISNFLSYGYDISEKDRFLQIFDLTFDLSIFSWFIPLLHGSCIYTIPKGAIRYAYAYELLEEHAITVVLSVPSFLSFLRPYFPEISLPSVKYWLFCGEALPLDILSEWKKCIPNAVIENVYGPTEATIFCTRYVFDDHNMKSFNGIVSIGKPFPGVGMMIVDESLNEVNPGETGELCLAGDQVTHGYLKNDEKNRQAFFDGMHQGVSRKFYRTGDLCFADQDGDYMYSGRIDSQVKIQGFRVELGEIENNARSMGIGNAVALSGPDDKGNTILYLFIEGQAAETEVIEFLKTRLPSYMLPKKIFFVGKFPLNVNGKIDKPELKKLII